MLFSLLIALIFGGLKLVQYMNKPVISINVPEGVLVTDKPLTINAKAKQTSRDISWLSYTWSQADTEPNIPDAIRTKDTNSLLSNPPQKNGSYKLTVNAQDDHGNHSQKIFKFVLKTDVKKIDDVAPTITCSHSSGDIYTDTPVVITANDIASNVTMIGWLVDGEPLTFMNNKKSEKQFTADINSYSYSILKLGKHVITIEARDSSLNKATMILNYNVVSAPRPDIPPAPLQNPECKVIQNDSTPPDLTLDKTSGTIHAGDIITITAVDENGILEIGYKWTEDETPIQVLPNSLSTTFSTQIKVPHYSGSHVLKVYVRDKSIHYNTTEWIPYTYTIEL